MLGRSRSIAVAATVAIVATLGLSSSAFARDDSITSFDGTNIVLSFFPAANLPAGQKAPTVLYGPGWSSGRDTDENSASDPSLGSIGVGPLRAAGYNVLTWDPRGFGSSGGNATVDSPDNEGRDVQELIDYVAHQPEAQLDRVGDPRVGMTGASYGGGIQLVTAGLDKRLDALVPDIAWHSLLTSLYKEQVLKTGWGSILYSTGKARGHLDPHIDSAFTSGALTGQISAEDEAWFGSRGPGDLVNKIRIPTFFTQGTADTLFTLDEAITNYRILRANNVPTKMLWFCGGHGICLTNPGDGTVIEREAIQWLNRYLKGDRHVDTGPRFEWIDQDGVKHSASDYPLKSSTPLVGTGAGTLPLVNGGGSGPVVPPPDRGGDRRARRERRGLARDQRGQRLDPGRDGHEVGDRRAEGDADLQRHRRELRCARLRPDRRRELGPRRRQPDHPDPARAGRAAPHGDPVAGGHRPDLAPRQRRLHAAAHAEQPGLRAGARRGGGDVLEHPGGAPDVEPVAL